MLMVLWDITRDYVPGCLKQEAGQTQRWSKMQANSEFNYQGCDGNEGPFSGERRSVEVVLVTQKILSHTGNGTETHIPYGRWQTMSQGQNVALCLFVWPVAKA